MPLEHDAFRLFLEKHHYTPQGRYARTETLLDQDFDALLRANLAPIWSWTWNNIKNAEDMEIIRRNVRVARYNIESFKHEREVAKQKRQTLQSRKRCLQESLQRAKERETSLLSTLRTLETEQIALEQTNSDEQVRDVLKHVFNHNNEKDVEYLATEYVANIKDLTTTLVSDKTLASESRDGQQPSVSPVETLINEYKRILNQTVTGNVVFGDNDIEHLRDFGASNLLQWLQHLASSPFQSFTTSLENEGNNLNDEQQQYAAHVNKHTGSSHDALIQIQSLLRERQKQHIDSFIKTQQLVAKTESRKEQLSLEQDNEAWDQSTLSKVVVETVALEMETRVYTVALHEAKRARDQVAQKIEASRQLKQELTDKVSLMHRFEDRQEEIVTQMRTLYKQNIHLNQSIRAKQLKLIQLIEKEIAPRIEQECQEQLMYRKEMVLEEIRAFTGLHLLRLDKVVVHVDDESKRQEMIIPVNDLCINQLRSDSGLNSGYQRIANVLKVKDVYNWHAILSTPLFKDNTTESESPSTVNKDRNHLEEELEAHRTQCDSTTTLLHDLQRLTREMNDSSRTVMDSIVSINQQVVLQDIPSLEQAIHNWFEQPAWRTRLEQPTN